MGSWTWSPWILPTGGRPSRRQRQNSNPSNFLSSHCLPLLPGSVCAHCWRICTPSLQMPENRWFRQNSSTRPLTSLPIPWESSLLCFRGTAALKPCGDELNGSCSTTANWAVAFCREPGLGAGMTTDALRRLTGFSCSCRCSFSPTGDSGKAEAKMLQTFSKRIFSGSSHVASL